MRKPEKLVGFLPDCREREDEDDDHGAIENNPCQACHGLEEPVADVRLDTGGEEDFLGHALEVMGWLGPYMVEVDQMAQGVNN